MRPLAKTSLAAGLFLVPLWMLVCNRPVPINPELVPLPFKVQERPKPSLSLTDLNGNKVIPIEPLVESYDPAVIPLNSEPNVLKMRRFSFNYGALEVQDRDAVRLKGAKVGIDYYVDEQQSVGVETSQQIYDRQDAGAWDKDAKDESTAGIKYKLIF